MNIVIVGPTSLLAESFMIMAKREKHKIIQLGRKENLKVKNCDYYASELNDLNELITCVNVIYEKHETIDVVINFIGTHHKPMDFEKDKADELYTTFKHVMDINVNIAFMLTMIFSKKMISARHGHMLHLCSNASRLSLYGSYAYNASKHALEGLIKTAAAQLVPFKVRVNGIAPGTVISDLNRKMVIVDSKLTNRALSILAHTPSKQFCTLEGVSETILAACFPQRHLTGNIIFCDDGYNIEGHSWPDGNEELYKNRSVLE